ncbi:MAG: RusA family crossover junction endodeoxyribonuclease [Rhodobiaceae bacterium]|nr:RusA family crossover junction endodeoxyribonuclease [Rhodobiaceae bacterium]MCC0051840.1 RusA family crossover junction endodeoxyribonuclease [Rhodobiaceae bacterium]
MGAMRAAIDKGAAVERAPEAAGVTPAPVASYDLPAPPSANALFRNVKGRGRVKTKEYRDWAMHAGWSLRGQGITTIDERCIVLIGVERHSLEADIDNRAKATLDVLVEHGVLRDDNLVTGVFPVWQPKANHMARIKIFKCQHMMLEFIPSQDGASGAVIVHAPFQPGDH